MKLIDMETWSRRDQFHLYRQLDVPYVGLCADVDVTNLLAYCKLHSLSSYRAIIYALLVISDSTPWMRQRIRGEQVIEYDHIHAGVTGLGKDENLRFGRIPNLSDWVEFDAKAKEVGELLCNSESLFNTSIDYGADAVMFLSCVPWLRFTQFTHPVPLKAQCSVPRLGWGKYDVQGDRTVMPLSIQFHHGLADGLHVSRLYQQLEQKFAKPELWLTPAMATQSNTCL